MLASLIADKGDGYVIEMLRSTGLSSYPIKGARLGPLVADEMKRSIFQYLDQVFMKLETYCTNESDRSAHSLYGEMDYVHNVPMEICREKVLTKYGNLVNK